MAKWAILKAAIADVIKANGNREITGPLLQNVLNNIVSSVGENATFIGRATPSASPGAPDGPCFYIANSSGVYPNFNGLEVSNSELAILYWNGSAWAKISVFNNEFIEYASFTSKVPSLSITDRTFTIPRNSFISSRGLYVTITNDIVVGTADKWGTHFIILDADTQSARVSRSSEVLKLGPRELLVALVKWDTCVLQANFVDYYIGNARVAFKPRANSIYFSDYITLVYNRSTFPVLNTSEYSLTFKKGSLFFGNGLIISLDTDVVVSRPDSFGTHYIIINANKEIKAIWDANDSGKGLGVDEAVICCVKWSTGIVQANIFSYYRDGELINFKPLNSTSVSASAPKIYNNRLDLRRAQLRVLDIGNSYTNDCAHYLPNLIGAAGLDVSDMCLYKATRASGSFKTWTDTYYDKDTQDYSVDKVCGGINANITGTHGPRDGSLFRSAIRDNEWDLILIHQVSQYAPYYEDWSGSGSGGYLNDLIRIIRLNQPKATIGFLLVHSYWSGYSCNTEKSSFERWKLIVESAKKLRADYDIDFIIPYGTAIQNLRASSLNNEYDLTEDGTHNANGLADYTAACAYFQSVFAPRYGVSIVGNTARVTVSQTGQYPSSSISVTDENAAIAQKAAFLATCDWYSCVNPEVIEI